MVLRGHGPRRLLPPGGGRLNPAWDDAQRGLFTSALERAFEMEHDDAKEIADAVLDRFEAGDEVDDETLDADLRSVFYTLEAKKILSFRREEYVWENGEKRRGFWWRLRDEELQKMTTVPVETAEDDIYAMLPKSVWSARQNA